MLDCLINALQYLVDMFRDFVRIPFVSDGGVGGDEFEGMRRIDCESFDLNRRISQNGEQEKKGLPAPKGYGNGCKDERKLPFGDPEIAVDEDQFGFEPIKAKWMEVADTQKHEASECQSE